MSTLTIFGLPLAPLFAAIAQVESENGKTSDNVYQLQRVYLDDVGRIYGCHFPDDVATSRFASEQVMLAYLEHYGESYSRKTGKEPTAEVLARIHNGGPSGWRKPSTLKYWAKVKRELEKGEAMIPEDPLEYKDPRYAEPLHPWEAEEAAQEEEG